MNTKLSLLLFSILFLSSSSQSQDTVSGRYFPLQIGNRWVYRVETIPPLQNPFRVYSITKDTIINNHKYFFYKSYLSEQWLRYDSSKGNLLVYSATGSCSNYSYDKIMDSLSSGVGDIIFCQNQATFTRECTNIFSLEVFNVTRPVKRFEHDGLVLQYIDYARDIGIIWTASGEPPPANNYEILKGCIINGNVYGDTTLTSIRQINNIIPKEFFLHQNYPNPFNPKTIINYNILTPLNPPLIKGGNGGFVSLKVYDILGNEVATLVNRKRSPGNYSIEFDGTNFPSGIYFYKLESGDFVNVKKMLLIK